MASRKGSVFLLHKKTHPFKKRDVFIWISLYFKNYFTFSSTYFSTQDFKWFPSFWYFVVSLKTEFKAFSTFSIKADLSFRTVGSYSTAASTRAFAAASPLLVLIVISNFFILLPSLGVSLQLYHSELLLKYILCLILLLLRFLDFLWMLR